MALQRIDLSTPTRLRGLEALSTPEMFDFTVEMIRRMEQNSEKLLSDLRKQVITDPSILPPLVQGASTPALYNSATSADIENSIIFNIVWQG